VIGEVGKAGDEAGRQLRGDGVGQFWRQPAWDDGGVGDAQARDAFDAEVCVLGIAKAEGSVAQGAVDGAPFGRRGRGRRYWAGRRGRRRDRPIGSIQRCDDAAGTIAQFSI
jgi:hypothetical protein